MKKRPPQPRRKRLVVAYTSGDRVALALWLAQPWGGTFEQLEGLFEISEAFALGKVKVINGAGGPGTQGADLPPGETEDTRHEAELSETAAALLLELFPRQATPAALGPNKVRLLRALRAALPASAPKPAAPASEEDGA